MEYQEIMNSLKALFPIFLCLLGWYVWSVKQKFISKTEFKSYKDKQYKEVRLLEEKISKQNEDMREIKTHIKHMANSLQEIKEFILSPRKRRKD